MRANKPVCYPEWLARRWIFALSYALAVAICIILLAAGGGLHQVAAK